MSDQSAETPALGSDEPMQSSFPATGRLIAATLCWVCVMMAMDPRQSWPRSLSSHQLVSSSLDALSASCTWSPSSMSACKAALLARLCRRSPWQKGRHALGRRFLVMGDSTTGPYHLFKYLYDFVHPNTTVFPRHYHCERRTGERCEFNEVLYLDYPVDREWIHPNYSLGEGPIRFGAENKFCGDCTGCDPAYMVCSINDTDSSSTEQTPSSRADTAAPIIYGGFLRSEFARDVILQTPEYKTTQENNALFIQKAYNNDPRLLQQWNGRPVCLISTCHHDAAIPNMTQDMYVANVQWLLQTMQPQCEFIIFLGATLPAGQAEYAQRPARTTAWNHAVRAMVDAQPELRTTFIDVGNASKYEGSLLPDDNIHMEDEWYETLAEFLIDVISTPC